MLVWWNMILRGKNWNPYYQYKENNKLVDSNDVTDSWVSCQFVLWILKFFMSLKTHNFVISIKFCSNFFIDFSDLSASIESKLFMEWTERNMHELKSISQQVYSPALNLRHWIETYRIEWSLGSTKRRDTTSIVFHSTPVSQEQVTPYFTCNTNGAST